MAKKLWLIVIVSGFFLLCPLRGVLAWEYTQPVIVSPTYRTFGDLSYDFRDVKLQEYLESYKSPLSPYASFIVQESDRLSLDYRLLPAISGVESTFGKRIPQNSYNAYGWAIFTGKTSGVYFQSWEHGITTVLEGIRYKYVERGALTIPQIGKRYASSEHWPISMLYFLNDMETRGL